jgi:hypothetical protein
MFILNRCGMSNLLFWLFDCTCQVTKAKKSHSLQPLCRPSKNRECKSLCNSFWYLECNNKLITRIFSFLVACSNKFYKYSFILNHKTDKNWNVINSSNYYLLVHSQNCEKWLLASSCLSVCPYAWNKSAPTRKFFMIMIVNYVFRIFKSDKNNGYFTWRPIYIFYYISLISS